MKGIRCFFREERWNAVGLLVMVIGFGLYVAAIMLRAPQPSVAEVNYAQSKK